MKDKTQYFVNETGEIIAKGRITSTFIDLIWNDGTRYYSTFSVELFENMKIKAVK